MRQYTTVYHYSPHRGKFIIHHYHKDDASKHLPKLLPTAKDFSLGSTSKCGLTESKEVTTSMRTSKPERRVQEAIPAGGRMRHHYKSQIQLMNLVGSDLHRLVDRSCVAKLFSGEILSRF
jgi:hypothetical protein